MSGRRPHTVAALVAHGVAPFELGVPCEVFGIDRSELVDPWYDFFIAAAEPGPLDTGLGFTIDTPHGLDDLRRADTIIVPAWRDIHERPSDDMLDALRAAHARGTRLLTVCSGAFVLGHAGLLDGRRATTHWMYAEELAAQFPEVDVDPDVLYVDDGDILTSAGTAAGIDLCLHIVRLDHGADVANAVARRMVVPPHRDGGQAQFVETPVSLQPGDDPMLSTLDWAMEHLHQPLSVELLAHRATMSPRTFARRFRAVTGTTPLQWVLRQRVLLAQRLLECTEEPVELIAQRCGFGSAAALRTHFGRVLDTSPMTYRRTFRQEAS
jgi:transcriptional regulator GlxA family with amidase domain